MTRKLPCARGRKRVKALPGWCSTAVYFLALLCLSADPLTTTKVQVAGNSCYPNGLELSTLDGTNGFAINGETVSDESGGSVSYAGDVNGDGIGDIIIGASGADPNDNSEAGTSYVVFGKNTAESTSFPSDLELSSIDVSNGFAIHGEAYDDHSGISVSYAGDLNGDSIDDIIIGAYLADPNSKTWAGKSYVVFGRNPAESSGFPEELDLTSLDGTNGFAINGEAGSDFSGGSVSYAGDLNGDNVADIIIGAPYASPNGKDGAGASYVVFGRVTSESTHFPSELELSSLNGTNGFAIHGEAENDNSGISVSFAGDVNGDNIADIIIGAHSADPDGISDAGTSYVVFGKNTAESASFPAELDLSSLNRTDGFAIHGEANGDESGISVSFAGDTNGDNIDDIIIGARYADANGISDVGKSYIVFGKNTAVSASFSSELKLSSLNGTNGFAINGEAYGDWSGHSVSYAGDLNDDNIDDIIIGAYSAGTGGTSYVVFGKNTSESASFPLALKLSSLDGTNGFAINGEDNGDNSGTSVSNAGDLNHDGIADIIIGASGAGSAGKSYVVFGVACTKSPTNSPTVFPTPHPTILPTPHPTLHPTSNPTFAPTAIPTPIPTELPTTRAPTQSPTLRPTNEPVAQTVILSLLFETPFVGTTHDSKAFKDAICEVVSTVTGLQCGENLKIANVQDTTSSEGEQALLISYEIPKGSIDEDNLDELAAEINSELSSSNNEDVRNLAPVDEISYDDASASASSSSSSLSTEAIVGIAIGSVIAMAGLVALGYKKINNRQHSTTTTNGSPVRTQQQHEQRQEKKEKKEKKDKKVKKTAAKQGAYPNLDREDTHHGPTAWQQVEGSAVVAAPSGHFSADMSNIPMAQVIEDVP